jgi:hypothetical protein
VKNFPFVSKIRQAAQFFGASLPFKHDFKEKTKNNEENPSSNILKTKLKSSLEAILHTSLKYQGNYL